MSTQEHKAKFTADTSGFEKGADRVASTGSKLIGKLKAIGGAIVAAFSIRAIANFGKQAVELASQIEGVRAAFGTLNKPDLLADLQKATRGTVTELELMKKAVQARNFKIPLDQLATYFEFATKRAIQTGESVDYLVDSIITGIGRKSVMIMDNLGISSIALQDEVKKVGDFGKAAGNIIQRELKDMGDVADTTATKIARINTAWKDLKTSIGESIVKSKAFTELTQWAEDMTTILSDPRLTNWQKFLTNPDEYKAWKKQEEERRSEWRKTLSVYDDTELAIRRGVMAEEEANRQIELEIEERAALKKQFEEDLKILKELNTHIPKQAEKIEELKTKIETLTDSLETLTEKEWAQAGVIRNEIKSLQDRIKELTETHDIYRAIIKDGKDLANFSSKVFIKPINILGGGAADELVSMKYNVGAIAKSYSAAQLAAAQFGTEVMSSSIEGVRGLKEFAQVAVQVAKKIIATYLAEGVAAAVKGALTKVPFPFNIIAAGVAGGAAAALFNSLVPDFAAGGAVSGPTMALVGEAPGISASNPEYIGTAKQLAQMGMGAGRLTCRVSRGDLLFILNEGNASNTNNY